MTNPSIISYFPNWRSRWKSFCPQRNRGKRSTGLLAMAGAAAMDSFVGQVWLGQGCEPASVSPLALDYIARKDPELDSPVLTARHQQVAN